VGFGGGASTTTTTATLSHYSTGIFVVPNTVLDTEHFGWVREPAAKKTESQQVVKKPTLKIGRGDG